MNRLSLLGLGVLVVSCEPEVETRRESVDLFVEVYEESAVAGSEQRLRAGRLVYEVEQSSGEPAERRLIGVSTSTDTIQLPAAAGSVYAFRRGCIFAGPIPQVPARPPRASLAVGIFESGAAALRRVDAEQGVLLGSTLHEAYIFDPADVEAAVNHTPWRAWSSMGDDEAILSVGLMGDAALRLESATFNRNFADEVRVEDGRLIVRCPYALGTIESVTVQITGPGLVELRNPEREIECTASAPPVCELEVDEAGGTLRASPRSLNPRLQSLDRCTIASERVDGDAVVWEVSAGTCAVDFDDGFWAAVIQIPGGETGIEFVAIRDSAVVPDGILATEDEDQIEIEVRRAGVPVPVFGAEGDCRVSSTLGRVILTRPVSGQGLCSVQLERSISLELGDSTASVQITPGPGPSGDTVMCDVDASTGYACTQNGQPLSLPLAYSEPAQLELRNTVLDAVDFIGDCMETAEEGLAELALDADRRCTIRPAVTTETGNGTVVIEHAGAFGSVDVDSVQGADFFECTRSAASDPRSCSGMNAPENVRLIATGEGAFTEFSGFRSPETAELGEGEVGCPMSGMNTVDLNLPGLAPAGRPARTTTFRCIAEFTCAAGSTRSIDWVFYDGATEVRRFSISDPGTSTDCSLLADFRNCSQTGALPDGTALRVEIEVDGDGWGEPARGEDIVFSRINQQGMNLPGGVLPPGGTFTPFEGGAAATVLTANVFGCEGQIDRRHSLRLVLSPE